MSKPKVNQEVIDGVKDIVSLVRHFVDHPEAVEVNIRPGAYRVTAELYTDARDVGQVVGRNGHLTSSLRAFLAAVAGKHRIKINMDYVTEEDNARKRRGETVTG